MGVGIDSAGEHEEAPGVDHDGVLRLEPGSHLGDLLVLDPDVGLPSSLRGDHTASANEKGPFLMPQTGADADRGHRKESPPSIHHARGKFTPCARRLRSRSF